MLTANAWKQLVDVSRMKVLCMYVHTPAYFYIVSRNENIEQILN